MNRQSILSISTPAYVVDERLLIKNLECLSTVMKQTGCKILLAQKAYSMYASYPLIGEYLSGTTASSLFEARLGFEEMGKETHIYAPAFREDEFDQILEICDHIIFNSPQQWQKYQNRVKASSRQIECGIRINPEYSEIKTDLYNPCFKNSRLGTIKEHIEDKLLEQLDGIHFHTMCEQNADTLERTLTIIEAKFGSTLHQLKWINFGGGHHITKEGYDIERLINCINRIQDTYQVQVYLEPGEAVALNAGFLVTQVLEIMENGMKLAILDTSAACHMPDVIEMPYRPEVTGAGRPEEKPFTYRFGGPTCLAGDIIGDYSFDYALKAGDRLIIKDMAIYSMVKNNTFNGIKSPAIYYYRKNGKVELVKEFGYQHFKDRL